METLELDHRCILLNAYEGSHRQENLVIPIPLRYSGAAKATAQPSLFVSKRLEHPLHCHRHLQPP